MKFSYRLGAVTAGATALATAATVLAGGAAFADESGPVDAGIYIQKVDGLPSDFIDGVDVSSILSEEESGVVFHDFAGNVADPFDVLAEAGINYVRVRVWNDPYNSTTHLGYGAGNTDAARALEIGERATAAGLKVLVDFHYSDFWADPGKQKAPKAWAGYTVAETATAVHDFTATTLQQMEDAGVDVGMVQVGNETNNGVAGVTGIDNMSQIFSAGSSAVRDVYPGALVALHFTNPETSGLYANYAAALDTNGVDYDVFASSYYPYWHGTTTNLTSVLSDIATTYDKKVMVAETAYPNTLSDGDGTTNSVTSVSGAPYAASVQGQATEIRDVMAAVNAVGSAGIGVFYWEPAWIPVPGDTLAERQALWAQYGSGWATTAAHEYDPGAPTTNAEGSGWDNQALFDSTGHPLESLRAFAYARTGAVAPLALVSVEHPTITITEGDALALPTTVEVTYNDTSTADVAVTWNDVLSWITSPGTYTVGGVTADGDATTATVVVKAENYLVNGDFEAGLMAPWWTSSTDWPSTGWIYSSAGNNAHGTYAVNFYDGDAYNFGLNQSVALDAGTYTFRGSAHGADVTPQLYVTTSDGTQTADFALSGWQQWKTPSITFTIASAQTVTVGAKGADDATSWSWYDDFELVNAVGDVADTSALQDLVTQADGLTRSVYSDDSLAGLDSALEVANIVLAASAPTSSQVTDAIALVEAGLAGLVIVGDVPDPTVAPATVSAVEGDPITLPSEATVTFFDGRHEQQSVTWDDVLGWIDGPGVYTVHGVTEGGLATTATVTVSARNWVVNGSFEEADTSMWAVTGTGASIGWSADSSDGNYSVPFWAGSGYSFAVSQQITGLPAGKYVLSATSQGGGVGDADTKVLSVTSGDDTKTASIALGGWQAWDTATTPAVTVGVDGTATVSAAFTLSAGAWGTIDDFRLMRVAEPVDATALEAALAQAEGIDRDLYVADTLPAVDSAIAAANIVLQADHPSQDTVDAATAQLQDAIAALDLIDVAFTTAPTPTITGTAKYGSTLSVSAGTWVPTPPAVTYQWQRNGVDIPAATGTTYKPVYGDIGASITVAVTGSKADYITATKTSASVTIGKGVFTTQPTPKISGTPIAGRKLTAVTGTWVPSAAAFEYQWLRDGKAISGQKGKTYTVKSTDLKHKITVKVTALKVGYTAASKTSASVTIVRPFFSTGYATISGTAKVGSTLTAHRGLWLPAASSYAYQWYRNGVAIPGATNTTYTLVAADNGKKVAVKVTATKAGYLPASDMSLPKTVTAN